MSLTNIDSKKIVYLKTRTFDCQTTLDTLLSIEHFRNAYELNEKAFETTSENRYYVGVDAGDLMHLLNAISFTKYPFPRRCQYLLDYYCIDPSSISFEDDGKNNLEEIGQKLEVIDAALKNNLENIDQKLDTIDVTIKKIGYIQYTVNKDSLENELYYNGYQNYLELLDNIGKKQYYW